MTLIEEQSNNRNEITKTGDFSWIIIEKLENSEDVNRKDKKSYKKAVWQEKIKYSGVETRRQCVVGSQKHSDRITFKEAKPEKI